MTKRLFLFTVLSLLLAGMAFAQDATPEAAEDLPDVVVVEREGLFPEGVAYDSVNERWLVSSTSEGTVFTVDDEGTPTPLVEDERIPSSLGLAVDEAGNRLLVAATDMEEEGYLGIYNLTTGEPLAWVDLKELLPDDAQTFVNDVTFDSAGNAYVTDSYAGVIYIVQPDGTADIFLQDDSFTPNFTLNGIVFHEASASLIAVRVPELIVIPLANPTEFITLSLEEDLPNADGLALLDDSTLVAVNNSEPAMVYRIESQDNFATAQITGQLDPGDVFPTTIAIRDGEAYVLHAQLDRDEASTSTFPIERVVFEDYEPDNDDS
jgi:sugar lactone lactonase YvrE